MSANLIFHVGREEHVIDIEPLTQAWIQVWFPHDTLPDLWVYAVRTIEGVVIVEYEWSNASIKVGTKAKPTVDAFVKVEAPEGWVPVYDCDRPIPTRWFPMRAACRRMSLYPESRADLAQHAETMATGFISSLWGQHWMKFGPCNLPLPSLTQEVYSTLHAQTAGALAGMRTALQNGYPFHVEDTEDGPVWVGPLGWRPHGPVTGDPASDRARPGGSGINHETGYQGDADAVALFWLQACCTHERAWHAYSRETGEPITADDYPWGTLKYSAGTGDPNNGWLPEFTGIAEWPDPLPLPYDAAHSIRGVRHAIALSEMTESPMAKRMIASEAAQMRLQFGEAGAGPGHGYSPPNLRTWLEQARANPNVGGGMQAGRISGWPAYIWAADLKVNGNTNNSAAAALAFLEWARLIAPAHGVCQRVHKEKPAEGVVDVWYDPTWDLAHSFEVPLFYFGVAGCARQTGSRMPKGLQAAAISMLETIRKGPYYSEVGPAYYPYVAHRDGPPLTRLTDGRGDPASPELQGDADHQENFAALAYSLALDPRFLNDSLHIGLPAADLGEKRASLQARTKLYMSAFLLARLQRK